ncbi:protealysin inhibitor emfourin [Kribbella monticola]|uniref:protealysin inhibitor emfourin n=1 Tax=Kribbella monticola TaxID=2185285 RepID=UPI000DD460BC|nr:protealysin inhibitor emfourin [Kribbella monticola]
MILKVVRTGGFAGLVAQNELDAAAEPDRERLEQAAHGLQQKQLGSGRPQPDRYVFRLELRDNADAEPTVFTVAEQDLDQETAWLVDRVLQRN